jgi:type IV secretion system protein VirD4
MDEFAQLGRLDSIFEGVTFFRSFGLRLLAILQSPSQLRTNYSIEGAKTFEQSFDCSVFYTPSPRDIETGELVSKLLGNNTVKGKSESKRKGWETKYDSTSTSDQKRALLLPQEVMRMSAKKEIVLISGVAPILATKVRAWEEPMLLTRNGVAPVPPKVRIAPIGAAPADLSSLPVVDALRSLEPADIGRLQQLELEDFSIDFSGIEVPKGELTDAQKDDLANVFAAMVMDEDNTRADERDPGE